MGKKGFTRRDFIKRSSQIAAFSAFSELFFDFSSLIAKESKGEIPSFEGEKLIPSTDVMCVNFCGIRVKTQDGVIRAIYGNPESPQNIGHLCPKGIYGFFSTYNPYIIKKPLKRTNPKKGPGEDPKWVEISYEEAFLEISKRLMKIKKEDPRKLIWQHGHGKYLIDDKFPKAFCSAFGTPNVIHRTTICEAARHIADEITWGYHGELPDLDNCNYFINMGSNPMEAEQWARWLDRKIILNMERGMKNIVIEPRLSNAGSKASEWIPIRPGKDILFLLGMAKYLIENNLIDEEFLINYTNSPFLLEEDGKFLKIDGKPLIFDSKTSKIVPYEGDVLPSLYGNYEFEGKKVKTAFEKFKEILKDLTFEEIEKETGIEKEKILKVSKEFGENAMIGSTIVKDGLVLRLRPVAIYTFRGISAHQYGVQANRARLIVLALVGALDSVGGLHLHDVYKKPEFMQTAKCQFPPERVDLQESVYFPHSTHNIAQQVALTLTNPKEYYLPYEPEMMICYATNRLFSTADIKKQIEGYKKIFTVAIDIFLTEMCDMADIVLPDRTYLESYHWSPTRWNLEAKHIAIRQPIVNVYNIKYDAFDILMELAERVGILDKYIDNINKDWKINLKNDRKYTSEEVISEIAKANGTDLEYLKSHGLKAKKVKAEEIYLKGIEEKFKGAGKAKLNFYAENLIYTKEKVKEIVEKNKIKNVDLKNLDIEFSPFPLKEHAFPSSHKNNDFPFYLITYKRMYFTQSGTAQIPLLREISQDSNENFVLINKGKAKEIGIEDGEFVFVESKIGKIKIKAKTTEGIRNDTVAISYHYGHFSSGIKDFAKKGENPNWIIELYPDRISGMNSFNDTKVKIYKA